MNYLELNLNFFRLQVDIKEADPKIKEYYKIYWRLKSSLLEQQILGSSLENLEVDHDKDVHSLLQEKCENVTSKAQSCQLNKSGTLAVKTVSDSDTITEDTNSSVKSKAEILVKPPRKSNEPKKWLKSASSKLFEGSSFKKRNPRKALQKKSQLDLSSSFQTDSCEQSFMSNASFQSSSCDSPLPDMEANDTSFSLGNEVSPKIKSLIESSSSLSPLFASSTKVKIVAAPSNTPPQSNNLMLQNSRPKTARKLDVGWVERCTQMAEKSLEEGRISLDSGFGSASASFLSTTLDTPTLTEPPEDVPSSDDELICDSDDENSSKMVLSLKRKADNIATSLPGTDDPSVAGELTKKIKFEHPLACQISAAPQTSVPASQQSTAPARSASILKPTSVQPKNRVDQVKKEVLEKKIKAGTLNENYVKINIKKKVFVRGKRTFNFGKHKKTEWKKKKRELDAGGEIGGILRCYKCGDVGHYARSCQSAKEDKLIPVDETLEEDLGLPSLQEAEEMAREAALTLPVKQKTSLRLPQVCWMTRFTS